MALAAGVDLVVELPYLFACNSAPYFARGAVQALAALGGVDALCFGSEAGDLAPLRRCADLLSAKRQALEQKTRNLLRQGITYPAARARIFRELLEPEDARVLESPNNILGIEYLKALKPGGSDMVPLTLARQGAGFNDLQAKGSIASATGIRRMLGAGEDVCPYLPRQVADRLVQILAAGETPELEHFLRILLVRILRGADSLAGLYQVENGLENRLVEVALRAASFDDLIEGIKPRQLTRTRVQRLLCHLLNEVEAESARAMLEQGPVYLHLLGCSRAGEAFLAAGRKKRSLPLISNYSRIHQQLRRFYGGESRQYRLALAQLALELRAGNNYALLQKGFSARRQNDFFEPVRRHQP
jgi:predicted nucleotidyltransferase